MFDVKTFNDAFQKSLKDQGITSLKVERHHIDTAKANLAKMRQQGLEIPHGVEAHLDGLVGIDLTKIDFCGTWPKVESALAAVWLIIGFFVPGTYVAILKAVISAFDTTIYPKLCPTP